MKCQKNRACVKQSPNSLPDFRKICNGCDKTGKDKKTKKEPRKLRDIISDQCPDTPFLFMDPREYDKAIIGVAEGANLRDTIAYDYDKVIKLNMRMGMTEDEAIDYFNYNQIGAYVGEHTPIFIYKTKGE